MKIHDVLFTGYLHGYGGAEKSMIKVANALASQGFDVALLTFDVDNDKYGISNKVSKYFIPLKYKSGFLRYLEHLYKSRIFFENIATTKLVISFNFLPAVIFQFLAKQYNFKNYYSERGDPGDEEYSGMIGLVRKLIMPKMDGFIFQTIGARDFFSSNIAIKSVVIPNPVYIKENEFQTPIIREKIIISVGRLSKQKNFISLIEAFAKISVKFPEYNVHIYGEGHLKGALQTQINALGLENRIILKGSTANIFDAVVRSSVFVLPSLYEGMPNALMEAMALAVPSVSVDCPPGGPRDLISNGKNGLLCKTNNVNDLAEKLEYMLSHPFEAQMMGEAAKEICNTHSEKSVFSKWANFLIKELSK